MAAFLACVSAFKDSITCAVGSTGFGWFAVNMYNIFGVCNLSTYVFDLKKKRAVRYTRIFVALNRRNCHSLT